MLKIERVLKLKQVKTRGQYHIENFYSTKDDKTGVTLTKENRKLNTMLIGKCFRCGADFFGKFDYKEKDTNLGNKHTVDCPNDSCTVRMSFIDCVLKIDGEKPPKPVEEKKEVVEVKPVEQPVEVKNEEVKEEPKTEPVQ